MREHFAEAFITGYESLIGRLELPDADDRHILAAAIRCGVQLFFPDRLAVAPGNSTCRRVLCLGRQTFAIPLPDLQK